MPPETTQASSRNSIAIPIAIVIAGAMIAGAVYLGGSRGENPLEVKNDFDADVAPVTSADHIIGSPNANVVVVEYSDLECPFCKSFHSTMHRIVEDYAGKVSWVYRHYPIAELHSRAPKEAEASECAAEQGSNTAFWKYIDEVFATTNANNTLDPAELPKIAGEIGLDVPKFNECLSSGRYAEQIANDIEEAIDAGARGTPSSVILINYKLGDKQKDAILEILVNQGIPVNAISYSEDNRQIFAGGALPYELMKDILDILLAR